MTAQISAYFDNSATTQPCDAAVAAIEDALRVHWHNPSALYRPGDAAHRMVEEARASVAQALGAEKSCVYFTSGGTEADNWAIFSSCARLKKRGRHIITTAVEHHAVLRPFEKLASEGFDVTYLQPDELGRVSLDALRAALRPDTVFVSVMMVNNESGAVMPIAEMAALTHRNNPDALFHTDAVQGFFKVPFRANTLGADLISVSGHKVHATKGIGALYVRKGLALPPYLYGGGQESGLRSGTEPTPLIAGFGAACAANYPTMRQDIARMSAQRDRLRAALGEIDGVVTLGAGDAPHIVSFAVPGMRSQGILNQLQERGVYVSAGSACSRGHRSHVLEAMRLPAATIDGAVRASLSRHTTDEEVDAILAAVRELKR